MQAKKSINPLITRLFRRVQTSVQHLIFQNDFFKRRVSYHFKAFFNITPFSQIYRFFALTDFFVNSKLSK